MWRFSVRRLGVIAFFTLGSVLSLATSTQAVFASETVVGAEHGPRSAELPETLLSRSKDVMLSDPAQAVMLARAAAQALRAQPSNKTQQVQIATAQWLEGEGLMRLNDVAAAKPVVLEALRTVEQLVPKSKLAGNLLSSRAGLYASEGRLDKSLNDYQRAFAVFRSIGDLRAEAVALQHIGSVYQEAGDFERVLYYYGLSTDTFPEDRILQLSSSNNQANALDQIGRHQDAEREYKKALAIAVQLDNESAQARILDNLAQSQIDQGKLDEAARSISKGISLASRQDAAGWYPLLLGTAAKLSLRRGDVEEAIDRLELAFRKSGDQAEAAPYRDMHATAYEAYKVRGDEERALKHFEIFKRLDDQGRSLAASANATLAAARFDFANQNSRIAALKTGQLQRDFALSKLKSQQLTIVLTSLVIIAAIIAIMLALYLRSLRRSARAISETNTELNKANVALEDALHAKSQFLATTSHEIRTPLNGVLGMTQVLLADPGVAGSVKERVSLIHSAGESMRALVDDILDAAKSDAEMIELRRDKINLPALLAEVGQFWAAKADTSCLKLTVDVTRSPPLIVADEQRLKQIVNNIVANAIKFTPSGTVSVEAYAETDNDGESLVIRCTDTGIGIAEDRLDDVFEKFVQVDGSVTRRFGGTGLGLAICRKISRAMGGDVTVESKLGTGSTFTLTLPLCRYSPSDVIAETGGAAITPLERADVVVVQPNPLSRGIMMSVLAPRVGTLHFVESLTGALERIADRPAHLVVVDGLGGAQSGLDARQLLDDFLGAVSACKVPTVLLWPQEGVGGGLTDAPFGADKRFWRVLRKPVSTDDLIGGMRSMVEGAPLEVSVQEFATAT